MDRSLRLVMFGHDHAAIATLYALRAAGHDVFACFAHEGRQPGVPSFAEACAALGVPVTTDAPTPNAAAGYRAARPDLVLSVGYRRRIPLPFLALARWAPLNIHPGPLPAYRGPNPIAWGLLAGARTWAVTAHAMTAQYNDGGIVGTKPVMIRDLDNAYDLHRRCADVAARLATEIATDIAYGGGNLVAQDLREARFFDARTPHGGRLDWHQPADALAHFVRALDFGHGNPDAGYTHLAPPARATIDGHSLGLWRARAGGTASAYPPGTITRCDDELWVQTARGHLAIDRVCDPAGQDHRAPAYFAANGWTAGRAFDDGFVWKAAASLVRRAA